MSHWKKNTKVHLLWENKWPWRNQYFELKKETQTFHLCFGPVCVCVCVCKWCVGWTLTAVGHARFVGRLRPPSSWPSPPPSPAPPCGPSSGPPSLWHTQRVRWCYLTGTGAVLTLLLSGAPPPAKVHALQMAWDTFCAARMSDPTRKCKITHSKNCFV